MFLRQLNRFPALKLNARIPSMTRAFTATSIKQNDKEEEYKRPTLEEARNMPRHVSEYSADLLVKTALHGDPASARERLLREIMRVKGINYQRANARVNDISHANKSGLAKYKIPFHTGASLGFVACWASLPLVFDFGTAMWFNEAYVTTEVPPPEDLETWLEIGAWTWNWMEPFMGTLMFQFLGKYNFFGMLYIFFTPETRKGI
jgi:hypothetical protein